MPSRLALSVLLLIPGMLFQSGLASAQGLRFDSEIPPHLKFPDPSGCVPNKGLAMVSVWVLVRGIEKAPQHLPAVVDVVHAESARVFECHCLAAFTNVHDREVPPGMGVPSSDTPIVEGPDPTLWHTGQSRGFPSGVHDIGDP